MTAMQRVERELKARRISLTEFAGSFGVLPQHIVHWKRRGIPRGRQQLVADYFGWTLDYLLHGQCQQTVKLESEHEKIGIVTTLSAEELTWVELFRGLTPMQRHALIQMGRVMLSD